MSFTSLPKTKGAWELTCFRLLLLAGFILLAVQVWVRATLPGAMRQHIEGMLWPFPVFLGFGLICCSVVAFFQRRRVLGSMAAVVGVLSALIALLPILLREAIYD